MIGEAERTAQDAAEAAGVQITSVEEPADLDVLRGVMDGIWGANVVPPRNLLRGMALGGGCLLLAADGDGPVGFALGWLGWEGGVHLHSHQVGVTARARGAGVGLALKLAQRVLCLRHGITEMRWTFDPLLAANARFNLVRLGAEPVAFLPHCYGDRQDAFNTGDTTDRLEVRWRLDRPVGASEVELRDGDHLLALPPDYLGLRRSDPAAADEARRRVGNALRGLFADGGSVRGMTRDGYVLRGVR